MDIRIAKTEKAIKAAFLALRAEKPLERITVRELSERAQINKSTFYAHYDDIFALSEQMEDEAVAAILSSLPEENDTSDDPEAFTRNLSLAFLREMPRIDLIFSGREPERLSRKLEAAIRERIYRKYPDYRESVEKSILLSYSVQGGFHAYLNHPEVDPETLVETIAQISGQLQPLY